MVLFFGENSVEWSICYYGCHSHNLVTLPVSHQSKPETLKEILSQTHPHIIITSLLQTRTVLSLFSSKTEQAVIIIILCSKMEFNNNFPLFQVSFPFLMKCDCIMFFSFEEILELGRNEKIFFHFLPTVYPMVPPSQDEERESYSSMLNVKINNSSLFVKMNSPLLDPLLIEIAFTSGSTGKPKGAMTDEKLSLNTIFHSLHSTEPIIELLILPFSFGTGRDILLTSISNGGSVILFTKPMDQLANDLQIINPTKIHGVPSFWNHLYGEYKSLQSQGNLSNFQLQQKFSCFLGSRIRRIITGGAMTSPHVIKFLSKIFSTASVFNAYGSTEAGGIFTNGYLNSGISWKLRDVPELDYFSSDQPNPRGELIVKSSENILGYYRDNENNKKTFLQDGWYCTGDIVERLPSGEFIIIDRKSNIIKSAAGEFVSPSHLENLYIQSNYINQIYIHVSPLESSVLAIIEPSEYLQLQMNNKSLTKTQFLLNELRNFGLANKLRVFELPCGVYISDEKFTSENGCLTSSGKICRHGCAKKFKNQISELYKLANEKVQSLFNHTEISSILSDTLGYDFNETKSFQLDSLSAVQIMSKVEQKFSISLPVDQLLKINSIDEIIQLNSNSKSKDQKFLDDIQNFKICDVNQVNSGQQDVLRISQFPCIFLTGSTGIVGFYLLLKLLEKTSCKIICLIRSSSGNGKERILQSLQRYQPQNKHSYQIGS